MKFIHFLEWYLIIFLTLSLNTHLSAATCTTTAPDAWDCGTPTGADDLIVNHDVSISGNFTLTGSITVNSGTLTFTGATITSDGTSTITVNNGGTIQIDGVYNMRSNSVTTISGNMKVNGNMNLFDNSTLTVTSTGTVKADTNFSMGTNSTATIDGNLFVDGDFTLDGSLCGIGNVTFDGACSGGGDACGDTAFCAGGSPITSGALPIELLWFKAKQNGTVVELSWLTTSELNNDFFTIEKLVDLETTKVVTTVKGSENSHKSVVYSAIDLFPQTSFNYYRLKQTDFDGAFSYSNIVAVNFESSTPYFTIFPNPILTGNEIKVNINGLEGAVTLFVCDLSGRQVIKKFSSSVDIPQILDKHVQKLSPGVYFIKVIGSTFSISERLIVSH